MNHSKDCGTSTSSASQETLRTTYRASLESGLSRLYERFQQSVVLSLICTEQYLNSILKRMGIKPKNDYEKPAHSCGCVGTRTIGGHHRRSRLDN